MAVVDGAAERYDFLITWNCRHLANANKFDHISNGDFSLSDISSQLGQAIRSSRLRELLYELRQACLIEYTIPGKPKSRLQRYRLTDKGKIKIDNTENYFHVADKAKVQIPFGKLYRPNRR